MASNAPVKVDAGTDELITQAAHFLDRSKKDVVSAAVREYVDSHRSEIDAGIREALARLDGSPTAALSLVTGYSASEIDDLGGLPRDEEC